MRPKGKVGRKEKPGRRGAQGQYPGELDGYDISLGESFNAPSIFDSSRGSRRTQQPSQAYPRSSSCNAQIFSSKDSQYSAAPPHPHGGKTDDPCLVQARPLVY
jgi:hypothetical protein